MSGQVPDLKYDSSGGGVVVVVVVVVEVVVVDVGEAEVAAAIDMRASAKIHCILQWNSQQKWSPGHS